MLHRYFIRLSYKGTHFHGWQLQENAHTVQAEINKSLSLLLQQEINCLGCGRTDTGVHAKNYIAHFDLDYKIENTEQVVFKLNKIVHNDIAVHQVWEVNPDAHARFDAVTRTYEYIIARHKNPFLQEQSYYLYGELNLKRMQEGANILMEYDDFESFCKSNSQVNNTKCKITHSAWEEKNDTLVYTITANRFLRNMVRAIVGSLLELGTEKITVNEFRKIIESKNRSEAGYSVPAQGLFLISVLYPEKINLIS